MATKNYTAYADASARVSYSYPTTNFSTEQIFDLASNTVGGSGLFHFPVPPEVYKRKITVFSVHAYVKGVVIMNPLEGAFQEKTVAWANCPSFHYQFYETPATSSFAWKESGTGGDRESQEYILRYGMYTNRYSSTPVSQIHTSRSANKPYLTISTEDVVPYASLLTPTKGVFVNRTKPAPVSWSFRYDKTDVIDTITQKFAKLKWRVKGTTAENVINNFASTQPNGSVPANTFPSKSAIEWAVQVVSDDNIASAWSSWAEVNTTDAIPTAPTRLLPNGEFFESGQAITLTWSHNVSTASPQYAFDLDFSRDNGGSWDALATHTVTSTQQYVVQAGAGPTGKLLWRVRTYNTDNVASPWAKPAQVIVVGAPEIPAITSIEAGKSRPVVVWNSLEQESAQLVFEQDGRTVYNSGDLFGGVSTHKVAQYLADGTYTVKVRVKNAYDIWSDWAAAAHSITTVKRFTVKLTGVQIKNGVQLTFEPVENGGG